MAKWFWGIEMLIYKDGWAKYVTIGNAVALFVVQLIMVIYYIGDRK
ncbi:Uncharacterised protein [Moraxella caviae]|uniref:Uncharacterized protein n=1 Tax=Moraxella caviae TaxID=34060 RepID=A0A378R7G2_9GAMM|nr:Uncharacterised protein [Moraxella caviae]VEW12861.1 Uncharacterised protein [Moraxella caviae]